MEQVCRAVIEGRQEVGLRILNDTYGSADVIFLQELAPTFPARLANASVELARTHLMLVPPPMAPARAEVQTAARRNGVWNPGRAGGQEFEPVC